MEAPYYHLGHHGSKQSLQKQIELTAYPHILTYLEYLAKSFQHTRYRQALSQASTAFSFSAYTNLSLFVRSCYAFQRKRWHDYNPTIAAGFSQRVKLSRLLDDEYYRQFKYLPYEFLHHYQGVMSDNLQIMSEQIDHVSAVHMVESRHPFLDKRLIELCMAAPVALKYEKGLGRGTLRRAMRNVLPGEICRRQGKIDFSGFMIQGMETVDHKIIENVLFDRQSRLAEYIDLNKLNSMYQQFFNKSDTIAWKRWRKGRLLSKTAYLAVWLNELKY